MDLASIHPLIVINHRQDKTTKAMWDNLQMIFNQYHRARLFNIEYKIAKYSQGDLSIQDYFLEFQNLWDEFANIF